jgi:putative transposase
MPYGFAVRCAEKLCFSEWSLNSSRLRRRFRRMFQVSRATPAHYLTSVAHNRLPIFQSNNLKEVVCGALNEARDSGGILIFAYVIMPDHIHLITGGRSISETLRFTNGITAKRVIDYLKGNNFQSSLAKLRIQLRERKHKHSVFQHHPNAFEIYGEDTMMQKVNYVHLNPVRAGLVEHPDDYLYSSARQWHGKSIENEPLITDHHLIKWRSAA